MADKQKILIVDDDEDILDFISYNLHKNGYLVEEAQNGIIAIEKAKSFQPDLIVMDVMMPKMDGITACKEIKATPGLEKTAVIFLTARSEEGSELSGFDAGADDYINKPLKPRILISRIKAVLGRSENKAEKKQKIEYKHLSIDKETYLVTFNGKELTLPKKEFELLFLLASKPGKVFTREKILEEVWGTDVFVVDRTIDVHIRKLREKLNDKIISTIKGVGYKFEK